MTEQNGTDVVVAPPKPELVAGQKVQPIIPRTVEEAFRVAQAVIRAGLAPDTYNNDPQKVLIGIMSGAEVGLPPMQALKGIAIINGRPSIWGDAAVALVQGSGVLANSREWFEGTEGQDDWVACCALTRKGQDDPYIGRFSVAEAKRAKLWGNPKKAPWMTYPQRMLMWRARTYAIRDGFADCLAGLSIAEEARDIPAPAETTNVDFLDNEMDPKLVRPAEEPDALPVVPEAEESASEGEPETLL